MIPTIDTDLLVLAENKERFREIGTDVLISDPDLIRAASLKKTSLYDLAGLCGIDDAKEFTARFIDCDRKARRGV